MENGDCLMGIRPAQTVLQNQVFAEEGAVASVCPRAGGYAGPRFESRMTMGEDDNGIET